MQFPVSSTKRPKHQAKRLKRFLVALGYDVRLGTCHNLVAQMLGYKDFNDLNRLAGTLPLSDGDDYVDEETRETRRRWQISVLIDDGFEPEHAAAAVDEIRPTAYGPRSHSAPSQAETDFENEWGLRGVSRSFTVEVRSRDGVRSRSGLGRNRTS